MLKAPSRLRPCSGKQQDGQEDLAKFCEMLQFCSRLCSNFGCYFGVKTQLFAASFFLVLLPSAVGGTQRSRRLSATSSRPAAAFTVQAPKLSLCTCAWHNLVSLVLPTVIAKIPQTPNSTFRPGFVIVAITTLIPKSAGFWSELMWDAVADLSSFCFSLPGF